MIDKVIYEVQGEIPPTYCCDGKEAVEKLNNLHTAVDAALEYLSNQKKASKNHAKDNVQ